MRSRRARYSASLFASTTPLTAPKLLGSACVRSVARVRIPNAPPPPRSAQKRSGCCQSFTMRTRPSAVTTSASSIPAAPVPNFFEKLPKPPPSRNPPHAPTDAHPPPCA